MPRTYYKLYKHKAFKNSCTLVYHLLLYEVYHCRNLSKRRYTAATHKSANPPFCYCWLQETKICRIGVSSGGTVFISNRPTNSEFREGNDTQRIRSHMSLNTDGTGFHTCKECHKTESLWNHTTTDHKEGEQLENRRSVGASSCNSGDGRDQRIQSLMFMMMMMSLN